MAGSPRYTVPMTPHAAYTARLADRRAEVGRFDQRIDRLGQWRIAVFVLAAVLANVGAITGAFPWWWGLAAGVPFVVLFAWGKVLGTQRNRVVRAVRFYEQGLERLAGNWPGRGPDGLRFAGPDHPFAADLDVFGRGSLFQRVCTARTADGEQLLANWFLSSANPSEIHSRQEAVADLRDRLDLREYLAVAGPDVQAATDFAVLRAWAAEAPQEVSPGRRWAVIVLGWCNFTALLGWVAVGTTGLPLLLTLALSVVAVYPLDRWGRTTIATLERVANDLSLLETALLRFEAEAFTAERLKQVFDTASDRPPSQQIRELRQLANRIAGRRNHIAVPFSLLTLWDVRMAFQFDDWKRCSGAGVAKWLAEIADLEALSSLAGYSFENPADPFPTVLDDATAKFDAVGLGHPLLSAVKCIPNDVHLGGDVRVLVVSGSNMSGKSTLLRSIGANTILGLAGGTVRAKSLTLTPLAIGATIRVQDSLQDGRSRFFAEVTRVRAVLELATGPLPVLFLFDELFAGTNSADRVKGAEAVLRKLVEGRAIGLVTTHDLALTDATTALGGLAMNVHFADQITDGEMTFDYKMRPGVVSHGNGIALMRAVGLKV